MSSPGDATPTKGAKRRTPDWESIEKEYRAGQLSVSEIGRIYGVSHTAINKRAKKETWLRDLAGRVREAVSAKLVSAQVSDKSATAKQVVEEASSRAVQIITGHQTRIGRGHRLVDSLFGELEAQTKTDASLKDKSITLGNLTGALKNLIGLERQAFNLSDGPSGEAQPEAITRIERVIVRPPDTNG